MQNIGNWEANNVLAEITRLRQYIGGIIVYFLNRQGGSNLQDEH
jgi:hypothetical protein